MHGPCTDVLQPRLVPWQKVIAHVIQAFPCQGRCNPLVPLLDLWCSQVSVEITDHQQHAPPGPLDNGRDNIFYGQGVVWGQVSSHDKLLLAAQRYLESDHVRPVGLERFYGEVICRPVEYGNAADVRARRLRIHHPVATRLTRINTFCDLSLLEYAKVHVCLRHSAQSGYHPPVPTVPDVVRSETDQTYHPCLLP